MTRTFFFISVAIAFHFISLSTIAQSFTDKLASEFVNPPSGARPGVFWCWLNGNITPAAITDDLEQMKSKGIERAEIWDVAAIQHPEMIPAGNEFLGPESVKLIKHALAEGRRLNMKIGMIASSGWNAGGSWVQPHWASKGLYFSETMIEGRGTKISADLPLPKFPEHCPMTESGVPQFFRDVAVLAFPKSPAKFIADATDVIDVTKFFDKGTLKWSAPTGQWTILRFVMSNTGQSLIVPSPNSGGLFIDFFDPMATKRHLSYFLSRLGITPENSSEQGLAYFEFDSMELEKGIAWTDSMPQIFRARKGYSLTPYLPILAGWSIGSDSLRFMYDFKKVVSDQLIFSHYTTAVDFLKLYGIELVAEAGGPGPPIWETCPVDALKALGSVSVPRGEFWIRHRNMFLIKEVASAAHIYGKKIVDAESFTTWRRWKDSPFEMKKYVDRAFCEGLNNVTFHTFSSTTAADGFPGRGYHAGIDMNPGTTWWNKSKPFIDYLSRCSYLLQQGHFVADVCYYYGDQAPNFFPAYHNVPRKPSISGLTRGYDYDVVNSDVILNRMSVKDGRIVLPDGMSYRALVLPEQPHLPLDVMKKIDMLVRAGAVIIGRPPANTPGLYRAKQDSAQLNFIASQLWSSTQDAVCRGMVIDDRSIDKVLNNLSIEKDFIVRDTAVDYIHRSAGDTDIYFLRNQSDRWVRDTVWCRVTSKKPEFWDPSSGKLARVDDYTTVGNHTRFLISLAPHGSTFVIFANDSMIKKRKYQQYDLVRAVRAGTTQKNDHLQEIPGPWLIRFPPNWGAPAQITLDTLTSWTNSKDSGVYYFSGTASYSNHFVVDTGALHDTVMIDLGDVRDVAEVFVNGKSAGILWKKPYAVNIGHLLKNGRNDLRIEVVNMWVNRLTGDMHAEPEKRFTKTNVNFVRNGSDEGDETFRVQPSGLLGPVTLSLIRTQDR